MYICLYIYTYCYLYLYVYMLPLCTYIYVRLCIDLVVLFGFKGQNVALQIYGVGFSP